MRFFAGLGGAVSRYRFPTQRVKTMTGGPHGILGLDVQPADAPAIGAEIGIDAVGRPRRGPVFSEVLWTIRATATAFVLGRELWTLNLEP